MNNMYYSIVSKISKAKTMNLLYFILYQDYQEINNDEIFQVSIHKFSEIGNSRSPYSKLNILSQTIATVKAELEDIDINFFHEENNDGVVVNENGTDRENVLAIDDIKIETDKNSDNNLSSSDAEKSQQRHFSFPKEITSADDFFPIFIFVIIRAQVDSLFSICSFLVDFLDFNVNSETSSLLKLLEAALLHIVSNNWSGLDNALAKTETKTTES
jgi:hypothetical protein